MQEAKKFRRIALVGTAPSRAHAPYDDPTVEIWGVGLRGEDVKRATRWFEIHRLDGEPKPWAEEWRRLIKTWSAECEIYMFYPEPDLGPKVVHWDPKPLVDKYGTFFMSSTFSWMAALAIEEILASGGGELLLYGVDMEYGTEYREQRVGLRHFIDLARVLGIQVTRVASSGIAFEPIPYPFWQDDPLAAKLALRKKAFEEKRRGTEIILRRHERDIERAIGVIEVLRELPEGEGVTKALRFAEQQRESKSAAARTVRDDLAALDGSLSEIAWLNDYLSH